MSIIFEHFRCPFHRYAFSVKPVRDWVEQNCEGRVLNLFSGPTFLKVEEVRNDLDTAMPADFHLDAVQFLREWDGEPFQTVLLDPPCSYCKSMELYKGMARSPFRQLKDEVMHCLTPDGLVITFGYHSIVMGQTRGFQLEKLALFSHGGATHDTIATAERRSL